MPIVSPVAGTVVIERAIVGIGADVFAVGGDPVGSDCGARGIEGQGAGADRLVQAGFQAVLGVAAPVVRTQVGLRPKIAWVGRGAAEVERDEVIFLVVAEAVVAVAVGGDLLAFQFFCVRFGRPDGCGPAALADSEGDVLLGDGGIDGAGSEGRIGEVLGTDGRDGGDEEGAEAEGGDAMAHWALGRWRG
jgi:hypothetical protein